VRPSPLSARRFFADPTAYVRGVEESVVPFAAGHERYALVRDPELIWRVLVTDSVAYRPGKWKRRVRRVVGPTLNTLDGGEHRARRQLLAPVVARRRVAGFAPAIAERVAQMQGRLQPGVPMRLRAALDPLALSIAGDVLLSTDLSADADELATALRRLMASAPRLTPPLAGTARGRNRARVERVAAAAIARRRAGGEPGEDLIDALLSGALPDATMRGEIIAFLLASVDEPPSALEAAWYLLAGDPGAQDRLARELDAAEGDAELPYLEAVLSEALRLHPPARHIDRCPVHDMPIDGTVVRAGTNVLISPLVTHREARLHAEPAAFVPERWLAPAPRPARGSYLPFGAGAHTCVGEPLARAIMTRTLAGVARSWRVRLAPGVSPPGPGAPDLLVVLERR
jgi:cytochrome P450